MPKPEKPVHQPARPVLPSMRERMIDKDVDKNILADAADLIWFGLVSPPQKEFVAQKILRRYGLRTFVPIRTEFRHRSKYSRRRREPKQEVTYTVAPRLLFVGFKPDQLRWLLVRSLPSILGVVSGLDGRPLVLPTTEVQELIMQTAPGLMAPDPERFMQTHKEFGIGDLVHVIDGAFEGIMHVEVKAISGRLAKLGIGLFGGSVENVEIPLDYLEAA